MGLDHQVFTFAGGGWVGAVWADGKCGGMRERPSGGKKQEDGVEPLGPPCSEIASENGLNEQTGGH